MVASHRRFFITVVSDSKMWYLKVVKGCKDRRRSDFFGIITKKTLYPAPTSK